MDSVLHGITALPGDGRYAMTFLRPDGSEQTAVVHLTDSNSTGVDVAAASLPNGWAADGEAFRAAIDALRAFDAARRYAPSTSVLRDVSGGWDVSLGNVVLDAAGLPACTAHGALTDEGASYVCSECGARATLG